MTQDTQRRAVSSGSAAPSLDLKVEQANPLIVRARPGLSDASSALVRRLPSTYAGRTVSDVLGYLVDSDVSNEEASVAKSLKEELGAAGSLIVINGKEARLTDGIEKYLSAKSKDVGGRTIHYQELEIEVSAVQQGGYSYRI